MKFFTVFALTLFALSATASTSAITNKRDAVILNDDGIWRYKNELQTREVGVLTITKPLPFTKSDNPTDMLES